MSKYCPLLWQSNDKPSQPPWLRWGKDVSRHTRLLLLCQAESSDQDSGWILAAAFWRYLLFCLSPFYSTQAGVSQLKCFGILPSGPLEPSGRYSLLSSPGCQWSAGACEKRRLSFRKNHQNYYYSMCFILNIMQNSYLNDPTRKTTLLNWVIHIKYKTQNRKYFL